MTTTIQKGKRTSVHLVSKTHGQQRTTLQQNLTITPAFTAETEGEYGTKKPVLSYGEFQDCEVAFEYDAGDNKVIEAMLMDVNPMSEVIAILPDLIQPVQLYANDESYATGKVYQGVLVQQMAVSGFPDAGTLVDKQKYTPTFKASYAQLVKGAGILYSRIVASGFTGYPTSDDITAAGVGPYTATISSAAKSIPKPDGTTKNILLVLLNGEVIEDPAAAGITVSGTTVTFTDALGTGDVLEVFTAYVPA